MVQQSPAEAVAGVGDGALLNLIQDRQESLVGLAARRGDVGERVERLDGDPGRAVAVAQNLRKVGCQPGQGLLLVLFSLGEHLQHESRGSVALRLTDRGAEHTPDRLQHVG